jgi:Bacterial transglutaminase-like N-terminal region
MPTLSIKHITTYQYRKPVAFGEHRMMLRPRNGYDQSLIDAKLVITPTPISIRRTQDAFGNHLDIARFADRAMELRFESTIRLDHSHADIHDQDIEESARPSAISCTTISHLVMSTPAPQGRPGRHTTSAEASAAITRIWLLHSAGA